MTKSVLSVDWRETRRKAAREAILDAAWRIVRAEGLAGLSMRDLARESGVTPPTVYAYFTSKDDIYDAMFGQSASDFAQWMGAPLDVDEPRARLVATAHRFVAFCTADAVRYQLLFQRTLPGFEPSAASFEPSVRALEAARSTLSMNGITESRHVDLWTALLTGVVDQQMSNDPGGDRWSRLVDEAVEMYLMHCAATAKPRPRRSPR